MITSKLTWKKIEEYLHHRYYSNLCIYYSEALMLELDNRGYTWYYTNDPIFDDKHKLHLCRKSKRVIIRSDKTISVGTVDDYYYYEFVSEKVEKPKTSAQCCKDPNIVTNSVAGKSFKVCRNCKKEIQ